MNLLEINNEKVLPICLYGKNRPSSINEYNKKVMEYFNIPMNYIEVPFPMYSHGSAMNQIINDTIDTIKPDYYWFCDHDATIFKKECIQIMYDFVKNKQTVAGQMWQSNHKTGPNGMIPHAYVSQAFLWFSTELYNKLDRPDCDHWTPRSDTAEEITYNAKLKGYCIAGFYPSSSVIQNCDLDNGCKYGLGNIYGENLMAHASQQDNPESEKWFVKICQEVLDGKYD